jgi:L-threonylcarbamoyladenylate synthase
MEIITNPTQVESKKAAQVLKDGHLVAFPTETVYGLGADATNEKAVSRIYSVKGRPSDHPLIVHIPSIDHMNNWAVEISDYAIKLAEEFWPGPLTLILKRSQLSKDFITGGQNTVGLRVPCHPIALEVLKQFEKLGGKGIAAPSANKFGAVSPTSAQSVIEELESGFIDEDLILDGGQCEIGIESTIVDCTGKLASILRPGSITQEMLEDAIGNSVGFKNKDGGIRTSGLLDKHYAPSAKVFFGETAQPGDGFIALGNIKTPIGAIRLSSPETVEEFAKDFYNSFRRGDQLKLTRIVVYCPEGVGLAVAIRDRLNKASHIS